MSTPPLTKEENSLLARPEGRCLALVNRLESVENLAAETALIARILHSPAPLTIGFVNAHALNLAAKDPAVARAFLALDILLRDGKGVEILLSALKRPAGLNMNGTDFIPKLLQAAEGRRLALFGTQDPWLTQAAGRISAEGGQVVSQLDGFQPAPAYGAALQAAAPDLVVLAMGMPRQEALCPDLATAAAQAGRPVVFLCGGAILDFLAGRHARAPEGWQRWGIEWLWRLKEEPRRLAGRYLIGNAQFLWRVRQIKALNTRRKGGA